MISVRMQIDDKLYAEFKKLADNGAFQVTKLSKIIFEKALKDWIEQQKKKKEK